MNGVKNHPAIKNPIALAFKNSLKRSALRFVVTFAPFFNKYRAIFLCLRSTAISKIVLPCSFNSFRLAHDLTKR